MINWEILFISTSNLNCLDVGLNIARAISNNETLLAIATLKIMQKYARILETMKDKET